MRICEPRFLIFILTLAGVTAFSSSVALHAAGIHADQRTPQVSPEEDPFTRAVRLFYGESASSSLSAFEEIVNKHPDDTETVLQFAALLSETGRVETAEEVFRILSKTEPENETLRFAWFKAACLSRRLATAQSILPLSVETPEAAFWEGMLLLDLGRPAEALPCLRLAAELSTYNPVAQYMMGKTLSELGRLEEAEAALTTALKQEPSLSIAVLPLARVKEALGKHAEAYNQLLKARSLLLAEAETITTEIARMEASYPTLKAERIEQREKKRKTATPPLVKPPQPRSEGEKIPLVRVGLAERLSEVFIKTGGPATIKNISSGIAKQIPKGTVLSVRREGDAVQAYEEGGSPLLQSEEGISLSYTDPRYTTFVFDLSYEQGYFFATEGDRFYRGALEFLNAEGGITVVNEVGIDEYLYSVVPSEIPSYWPAAALEAQAVAARSYTLANLGTFSAKGFDLSGSVTSAAYRGAGGEAESTTAAVNATRGWVLLDGEKPLSAFYSSNSGGYTESTENVWGSASIHKAVPDLLIAERIDPLPPAELFSWIDSVPRSYSYSPPYAARSSYRWEVIVSAGEIEARLKDSGIGRIVALISGKRGSSGRVYEVLIKGTDGEITLQGDKIRSKLGGLKSNLFTTEVKLGSNGLPEYFIFKGAGWGHGVGMCQSGAAGMANAGYSSEAILAHYYPQAVLKKQ